MNIYYPVPEPITGKKARFIQIVNNVHALAELGHHVILLLGKQTGINDQKILKYFDLPGHPNLKFQFLPMLRKNNSFLSISWNGIFFGSLIAYFSSQKKIIKDADSALLFVRHPKLARFLVQFKSLVPLPLVYEIHEIFHRTTESKIKRNKLEKMEKHLLSNINGIVAISDALRQDLMDIFKLQHIPLAVIPNAVRLEAWDRSKPEAARGEYIFYAGSLYPWKGVNFAVEAIQYLPGERMVIAGGGARLRELENLAERLGVKERITFTGIIEPKQVKRYLARAKVAILPNRADTLSRYSSPLKIFEYAAAGIPIVASDIPGVRDIFSPGKSIELAEPGNPRSLALSIKKVIENKEYGQKIAEEAKRRIKDFTYLKRGEKLISFFERVSGQ